MIPIPHRAFLALAGAVPTRGALLPATARAAGEQAVAGGWFYPQAGPGDGTGYTVANVGAQGFYDTFSNAGGVSALGYPISRRYDEEKYPRPANDMPQGGFYEPTADFDNVPAELHQSTFCTEKTIEFIDEARDAGQPWLMSVNPADPHPPYDAPWEYYRRFDPQSLPMPNFLASDIAHQNRISDAGVDFLARAQPPEYWGHPEIKASSYAMIELMDEQFGRLLDHLDATGQRENTIVIFMSDHGEMLGDRGLARQGCRFYDPLVRVPLIVSWPGHFEQGVVSQALVELTDLAPTLLETAGHDVPDDTHGRSLLPLLTGEAGPDEHREFVRAEYFDAMRQPGASRGTMFRTRDWKLSVYHGHGIGELYGLQNDPEESADLWDDPAHAATKNDLLARSFDAAMEALNGGPPRVMRF